MAVVVVRRLVVGHPILECASELAEAMKAVAGVDPVFMSTQHKEAALVELVEARSRLDSLLMRVLASADDVAEAHGARDAAVWLATETRATRREAGGDLRLGRLLEGHGEVSAALAEGTVRTSQARAIVEALEALPASTPVDTREQARHELLGLAAVHDARDLKPIGKRILDVVAPEVGESQEARQLAIEEAQAAATASFTMIDDGEGRCHGRFTVPSHVGAMLKRHLLALANPARHDSTQLTDSQGVWKPLPQRLGEALVEYVERYPEDHTPLSSGVNATIVVTMTLEQLLGEQATALLDDGTTMSAGQARRLACEAAIVPAVLGSRSQPLDLGRRRRLFSRSQRIALGLRDQGCTAVGCQTSASGSHAHHDKPWSQRGPTDLANGRLLCPRHHRLAHDARYDMEIRPDNKVVFTRRS